MMLPKIPEIATAAYLDKVIEKVRGRMNETTNDRMKAQLNTLLQEAQRRKEQVHDIQQSAEQAETSEEREPGTVHPSLSISSASLTMQQQEDVKNRLRHVLEGIQNQQMEFLAGEAMSEMPPLIVNDILTLSPHDKEAIKARLKEQLQEFAEQQEQQESQDHTPSQNINGNFQQTEISDNPGSSALEQICHKIGNGEELSLFETIDLSEREKAMVNTLKKHLASFKEEKQRHIYEMQHLTTKSIRELDLIFKNYRLDGYLYADMRRLYNTLMSLKTRYASLF